MRKKPVYLNLFTIAFPVTAIVSILHRLSGLLLFFCIPLLLIVLQDILFAHESFMQLQKILNNSIFIKIVLWLFLSSLIYHLIAGIRHIVMDMGYGESKQTARITSFFILILSIIFSLLLGWKLW